MNPEPKVTSRELWLEERLLHAEALLMERCVYHAYNETNAALRADVTRLAQEAEKERAAAREAQREAAEAEARGAQLRRA